MNEIVNLNFRNIKLLFCGQLQRSARLRGGPGRFPSDCGRLIFTAAYSGRPLDNNNYSATDVLSGEAGRAPCWRPTSSTVQAAGLSGGTEVAQGSHNYDLIRHESVLGVSARPRPISNTAERPHRKRELYQHEYSFSFDTAGP